MRIPVPRPPGSRGRWIVSVLVVGTLLSTTMIAGLPARAASGFDRSGDTWGCLKDGSRCPLYDCLKHGTQSPECGIVDLLPDDGGDGESCRTCLPDPDRVEETIRNLASEGGIPDMLPLPVMDPTCSPTGRVWKRAAVSWGQGAGLENWGALYYAYPFFDRHGHWPAEPHAHFRARWHMTAQQSSIGADEFGYHSVIEEAAADSSDPWEYVPGAGGSGQDGRTCGQPLTPGAAYIQPGDTVVWGDRGYAFATVTTEGESCSTTTIHYESNEVETKASYGVKGPKGEISAKRMWGNVNEKTCTDTSQVTWDSEVLISGESDRFFLG